MFDLREFIIGCRDAFEQPDGAKQVRTLLAAAIADPVALERAMPQSDQDEYLLHACGKITIVILRLTPNVLFPPHNHSMPAVVGLYRGVETNLTYVERDGGVALAAEKLLRAPEVYELHPNVIHAVANHGVERSAALHVYGGDLIRQQRFIWNMRTRERYPYSDERYFSLTTPLDPSRPFRTPETAAVHDRYVAAFDGGRTSDR